MTDLVEFLKARLRDDLVAAELMEHRRDSSEAYSCPATRSEPLGDLEYGEDACNCGLPGRHARALREVEAKRRIMGRHSRTPPDHWSPGACEGCGWTSDVDNPRTDADEQCPELVDLAAVYSDHSDYDNSWGMP